VPARAAGPENEAAATALFEQARALVAAGDFAGALPKLVEANRLSPTIGTQLNIGICLEKTGKLASAWGAFKQAEVAARHAGDAGKQAAAAERAAAIAPRLAKLAIVVPPVTRTAGLEVRKDGELVGEGQWGSALPIDTGQHTIEATAPGHKAWSTVVRIETDGSAASVEVPALDVEAAPASAPVPFWSTQRVAGTWVGAAGVAGLLAGAVAGGIAASKVGASKSHCTSNLSACDPTGFQLQQDARTAADVSDVALAVGGAAVVTGLVVFFTSPKSDAAQAPSSALVTWTPVTGPRTVGLVLRGGW
jgi:hypothetical protein